MKIVEIVSGSVTSTKQFIGDEERDGSGAVTKQFFSLGQRNGTTNHFYDFDHLGSVRGMTSDAGARQAAYSFDPYGRPTKLEGTIDSDFQYAEVYIHARSGLNLAIYRAYSPALGRWVSRDPIAEKGGINLYQYVRNMPSITVDPSGLTDSVWIPGRPIPVNPALGPIITVGPPIIAMWIRMWKYNRCLEKANLEYQQCIFEKIYGKDCPPDADPDIIEEWCDEQRRKKIEKCVKDFLQLPFP